MTSMYSHIIDDKLCARLRESTTKPTSSRQAITRIIQLLDDLHHATTKQDDRTIARRSAALVTYAITLALMIDRTPNDQ